MNYDSTVTRWVWMIVSPILLIVGTVGNVLTIAILISSANSRKSSTAVYLIALAVTDLVIIDVGLLRLWIIRIAEVDIRHLSDVTCRLHWLLVYCATEISSWLLVAVTLERLIGIIWPHRVRLICRRKSAMYIVVTTVTVIFILCAHLLYGVSLHEVSQRQGNANTKANGTSTRSIDISEFEKTNQGNVKIDTGQKCDEMGHNDGTYQHFFKFIFPWVDLFVYGLIPAVILFVADILIIYKVYASRRLHRLMAVNYGGDKKLPYRTSSVTVMLVTVSVVFVLTTTPMCLFIIGIPYCIDPDDGLTGTQQSIGTIVTLLMYLNHSINFILYSVSGTNFRRKATNLFRGITNTKTVSEHSSRPYTI